MIWFKLVFGKEPNKRLAKTDVNFGCFHELSFGAEVIYPAPPPGRNSPGATAREGGRHAVGWFVESGVTQT